MQGKIKEAQKSQEDAAEQLCADMVYIGKEMNAMGCEGFNFDTAGSTGDAELYATLKAAREIKQHAPDMAVIIGMAKDLLKHLVRNLFAGKVRGKRPPDAVEVLLALSLLLDDTTRHLVLPVEPSGDVLGVAVPPSW